MQAARGTSLTPSDSGQPSDSNPSTRPRGRAWLIFWLIAVVMVSVDQWSKNVALDKLSDGGTKALVGDWFGLHLVRNPGAAFSFGTSFTEALTVVACVATVIVLWLSVRVRSSLWAVGLGFLLAGITGNLIDRLTREPGVFRGHVIDFFQFPNFPVFNVADVCINVAAAVIIIQSLRGIALNGERHEEKPHD